MALIPFAGRRRSGYTRLSPKNRRNLKVAHFGGGKRSWRLRLAPKLRLLRLASPVRLLQRLKAAYTNMMLRLATSIGSSNTNNVFGAKRIPKSHSDTKMEHYSRSEFESRLVLEIYKSMSSSLELGYAKQYS